MSKASRMYAFEHFPAGMALGQNVALANSGYSPDYPFTTKTNSITPASYGYGTFGISNGPVADGTQWLTCYAVGGGSSSSYQSSGGYTVPHNAVWDTTQPRSWLGFRVARNIGYGGSNAFGQHFLFGATAANPFVLATDFSWIANQSYYIEVMIDRVNNTRTVWVDGAMMVNAATITAPKATDLLCFNGDSVSLYTTGGAIWMKDFYFMDDPGDGSVSRLGPIIAKPIIVSGASGAGWQAGDAILYNAATITTTPPAKFGNASLAVNNTSYVSTPDLVGLRALPTGDITYETWFNPSSWPQASCLFCKDSGSGPYARVTLGAGTIVVFLDTSTAGGSITANVAPAANQWHHFALVRYNGAWTVYLDGVVIGTAASGTFGNNTSSLFIGNSANLNQGLLGNIDEFRVSNVARYTAAFTPPAQAFTVDANTISLYHFESAAGAGYTPNAIGTLATMLNTALNATTPTYPGVVSPGDGTPLQLSFSTTADPLATIQGVMLLGSGQRGVGTGTVVRMALQDQANPPNKVTLPDIAFPAGGNQYGKVLQFLPNALDGKSWSTAKIAALVGSLTATSS